MKGGEVINYGSETCIFSPPIMCIDSGAKSYDPKKFVSRYVLNDKEQQVQAKISVTISEIPQRDEVWQHFLFAEEICKPKFSSRDNFQSCPQFTPGVDFTNGTNLITRKFSYTFDKAFSFVNATQIVDLLRALVISNSYGIIVDDLILENIAYLDNILKVFDFGRSLVIPTNTSGLVQFKRVFISTDQKVLESIDFNINPQRRFGTLYMLDQLKSGKNFTTEGEVYSYLVIYDTLQVLSCLYSYSVSTYYRSSQLLQLFRNLVNVVNNIEYKSFKNNRNDVISKIMIQISGFFLGTSKFDSAISSLWKEKIQVVSSTRPGSTTEQVQIIGGVVINSGGDTCIFDPPLRCVGDSNRFPATEYISRFVRNSEEPHLQTEMKYTILNTFPTIVLDMKGRSGFVRSQENVEISDKFDKHFLFAEKTCKAIFENSELDTGDNYRVCPRYTNSDGTPNTDFTREGWNLITRRFQMTVYQALQNNIDIPKEEFMSLFETLIIANSNFIIVNDIILQNLGYLNNHIVVFDFGNSFVGPLNKEYDQNMETFQNKFMLSKNVNYIRNRLTQADRFPQVQFKYQFLLKIAIKNNDGKEPTDVKVNFSQSFGFMMTFDTLQILSSLYYTPGSRYYKNAAIFNCYTRITDYVLEKPAYNLVKSADIYNILVANFPRPTAAPLNVVIPKNVAETNTGSSSVQPGYGALETGTNVQRSTQPSFAGSQAQQALVSLSQKASQSYAAAQLAAQQAQAYANANNPVAAQAAAQQASESYAIAQAAQQQAAQLYTIASAISSQQPLSAQVFTGSQQQALAAAAGAGFQQYSSSRFQIAPQGFAQPGVGPRLNFNIGSQNPGK